MKISFYGAAEMVTGSCYLLETKNFKVLIDCGMFQGDSESDVLNRAVFNFNPSEIDYLLLTHAHIDHSGRIPLLVKRGFHGKIICTKATMELCGIMLPDSGYIQEMEVEWVNRKNQRAGKPLIEPLYNVMDAQNSLKYFQAFPYNILTSLNDEIQIRFNNAGHILGAAIVEVYVKENDKVIKIVFSGDLGNKDIPIMQNPSIISDADYLILESTYGNKNHKDIRNTNLFLLDIITDTIEKGGNVVIPSFAVGRTQEILYMLNMLKESKFSKIKEIPVFIDSPLAIDATKVFENNWDLFDNETKELIKKGDHPFEFPNLILTETAEESKAINFYKGSSIIVSASGMCDAGRIKHHLKHNLWRGNSSIVFAGYQAKGTLGRRILDGEKKVKIFGEEIFINSNIYNLDGLSGHADKNGIIEWISAFRKKPNKIFLTHGEEESLSALYHEIKEELGIDVEIAKLGETIDIDIDAEVYVTSKYPIDSHYEIKELKDRVEKMKYDMEDLLHKLMYKNIIADNTKYEEIKLKIKNLQSQIENLMDIIIND